VGTLSNRPSQAISSGCSVYKFHMDTLLLFFPPRARVSLQQKYYFRVQADGESLANYIADVKSHVKVFRLENSEADIVQTILDGLLPTCRSYLVFAGKPTSYADLDYLCVQAANAEYADKLRSALPESPTRPSSISRPTPSSNSSRPRPAVECFISTAKGI
jgi:hypothetical protein